MSELYDVRNGKYAHLGNFINDDVFNKQYLTSGFASRQRELHDNIKVSTGLTGCMELTEKRFNNQMLGNMDGMNYDPTSMPQSTAMASLFSASMNEHLALAGALGVTESVTGTKSTATSPSKNQADAVRAIGSIMNSALERIYDGPEMKSMAAQGVSVEQRAKIANNTFNAFINELEQSMATSENNPMREFLRNFRIAQNEERR